MESRKEYHLVLKRKYTSFCLNPNRDGQVKLNSNDLQFYNHCGSYTGLWGSCFVQRANSFPKGQRWFLFTCVTHIIMQVNDLPQEASNCS